MSASDDLVALLLAAQGPRPECSELRDWLPLWHAAQSTHTAGGSFTAAVAGALKADRVAWAFFSGYQGAIQAAFHTGTGTVGAFAANEAQRKITEIETSLDECGRRLEFVFFQPV